MRTTVCSVGSLQSYRNRNRKTNDKNSNKTLLSLKKTFRNVSKFMSFLQFFDFYSKELSFDTNLNESLRFSLEQSDKGPDSQALFGFTFLRIQFGLDDRRITRITIERQTEIEATVYPNHSFHAFILKADNCWQSLSNKSLTNNSFFS